MRSRRGRDSDARQELPSTDELLEIVHERGGHVSARDLARELGLRGGAKAELKRRLRDIESPGGRRAPSMALVEVTELDDQGELWGESRSLPGAAILIVAGRQATPEPGDRLLARIERSDDGSLHGHVFKVLPRAAKEVVGVLQKAGSGWWLQPSRKDAKQEYRVVDVPEATLSGDLVRAELDYGRPLERPKARVVERFGRHDEPAAVSMSVAVELGLPTSFPPDVLDEAARAKPVALGDREDLRQLPLVTIDGADARDFDDAVFATQREDGGFDAIVAIADVAHYVRPGAPLDKEALKRGNSVYFPDRVLPMLPEALSNGLCSLRPDEDRACLACHMQIAKDGQLQRWRFARAIMRSVARLTYEQVQSARDGVADDRVAALAEPVLAPLYALFDCLLAARRKRGTIELEIPERQVVFDADGKIEAIRPRVRLQSHMLIEEMMIAANVAAARQLAQKSKACIYRIHDKPDPLRLEGIGQFLQGLDIPWSQNAKTQADFNKLLASVEDSTLREQVSGLVLRSQAQARYSEANIGHFGLNLKNYAHFTSPIRRYSDLVLHRLLIAELDLAGGESGLARDEEQLARVAERVSSTERKAVDAERRAMARYLTLFMSDREGARFVARISSVQRFGLFVALDDTGAEGLVPVSSLGEEYFEHDERQQMLRGERSGRLFGFGDRVEVTLLEADTVRGMMLFGLENHEPSPLTRAAAGKKSKFSAHGPRVRGRRKAPVRRR